MSWLHGPLVAEAYDAKAPLGHTYGDVEYYTRHLAGVAGRILEVGSGTGRILIRLLEAGLAVEGLEHSPDMIKICRRSSAQRGFEPTLNEGDMVTFIRAGRYEAVIVPAGAISSLDGPDQTRQALRSFRESLTPGGMLILDLEVPGLLTGAQSHRLWRRGNDAWTVAVIESSYDPARNQVHEFVRYDKWTDGALVGSELHTFRTQHWVPEEFAGLLEECGFQDIRITANYDDDARPGPRDRDWSFHAVRS